MSTNASDQQTMSTQNSPPFASAPTFSSAPLPSPSQTQQSPFFGASSAQAHQNQASHPFQHGQQAGNAFQNTNNGGAGNATETAPFLKDFSLLAEAAKRAQMACLMRDMGEVEL